MADNTKILFTGITGLLGQYFIKTKKNGFEVFGLASSTNNSDHFKVNIRELDSLVGIVNKVNPKVIIHAASIGNVDYCEQHPEEAYAVNVEGTKNIIVASKKVNAKLIFISSNAVYNGINPPYNEEAKLNPVDVYGKTKVEGEKLVSGSHLDFCILRLITMYGWPAPEGRSNPVSWMIDKLSKGEKINVVSDIYNNHLWAQQAAEVIWAVIEKNISSRTYNIAGADCINRYNLALKVAKVFNLDPNLISEVTSDFFKEIAPRPKNTCFDTTKMTDDLGIKPLSIDEGLKLMRAEKD